MNDLKMHNNVGHSIFNISFYFLLVNQDLDP